MGMRLAGRIVGPMDVLVMLVVHVRMDMLQRFMHVLVLVVLGQMQPHAQSHQHTGRAQLDRQRLLQKGQRRNRSEEGRRREVGPRTRRPEVPQGIDEQNEADAIAEEAH
jgi:hypothetical protein